MLEKILTEISKLAVLGFFKKEWERFKNRQQNSENAAHDYDTPYKKRHGKLQVSCIGMAAQRSLDDIYVTVQFLNKRRATKHTSLEDIEKAFRKRSRIHSASTSDERQDGMRVANNEQYLMVLGSPGVGKSTFLCKVGFEALKGEDGNFEHQCIPVFLELRRFTEDPIDIEAWIINELKVCRFPHPELIAKDQLEKGELLILFDGLDEVPKANFSNVTNKIRDFVHQYSQNRFIVSCRAAAYTGGFAEFTVVEIADFDDSQIQDYINNRFASASNQKMKTAERCWQTLNDPEHQATKVLAQNPLSLALLCQVYEDLQDFPSSQTILYEKIIGIFLKKWTAEKGVRRDPPMSRYLAIPTVKELLSEIAAENFKADRFVFSEDEFINQIQEFYRQRTDISSGFDASGILDAILVDPGFFVERANGIYSFFHLTFQEYLTANHFVRTQSIQNLVSNHLHDERWREVFLFAAKLMAGKAGSLLAMMEAEASKCVNTNELKILFQWAKRVTNPSDNRYDRIAKQIFAIRQYFSLWLLNETYKAVNSDITQLPDPRQNFNQDQYLNLYVDRDLDMYLYRKYPKGYRDIYQRRKHYRYQKLDRYLDLYLNLNLYTGHRLDRGINQALGYDLDRELDSEDHCYQELSCYFNYHEKINDYLDPYFYQDPYQYIDIGFYCLVSDRLRDRLDSELRGRTTLLRRMKQMKIFKKVNLQRMVDRFNEQREFIKAAAAGESVEPPTKSIHNTWLSVLGIADEMLAIPRETVEAYVMYLAAVELIVACKEAAGRVSPEVWQQIEDRFLTVDAADIEN